MDSWSNITVVGVWYDCWLFSYTPCLFLPFSYPWEQSHCRWFIYHHLVFNSHIKITMSRIMFFYKLFYSPLLSSITIKTFANCFLKYTKSHFAFDRVTGKSLFFQDLFYFQDECYRIWKLLWFIFVSAHLFSVTVVYFIWHLRFFLNFNLT